MAFISKVLAYIALGLVQGFSEPIPISSSGHLVIFKALFENHLGIHLPNVAGDMAFDVLLHLASLLAIMYYYRKTIARLFVSFFAYLFSGKARRNKEVQVNFRYVIYLIIATIPAAIVGYFLEDKVDALFQNVKLVGCALIVTSVFLMLLHVFTKQGKRTRKSMKPSDAFIMGIFQCIALIPGISRSGSTMTGGMFVGLTQKTSRDFSFFMFMPVALGSVILKLGDLLSANLGALWFPYIMSFVICMFTTYFAMKLLFSLMKKRKMYYFSIYCFVVGIITILFI